jgi:SAM-dependent methyltransferase
MSKPVLINIGCGRVWHPDWINLDHRPTAPEIRPFDIRKPLPFGEGVADAVYASHVLEHLERDEARRLLRNCRRILRPGGLLRVVVPDLEDLCRFYLERLQAVIERPDGDNEMAYNWAYLHLLDQHVRRQNGGEQGAFMTTPGLTDNDNVRARLSTDVLRILYEDPDSLRPRGARGRLRQAGLQVARRVLPQYVAEALESAFVLRAGELHRVAYDRFSLPRLLREAGFMETAILDAYSSGIPDFAIAELDCVQGKPRKPGSLYVEAVCPWI